ncbi:hypothetical protein UFOVP1214_18 [uncultured Caudovirales phage]|uniref:Uncharacterized protein n=1 Tax=uncultured Caudovirales phage TaxID=2100421 RepID=A0A6J5R1U0_9CAUD|nr:hypothetical protein UFOVP1046_8 [uncultured Caudovirales phage]CAB4191110.1 hypothetical protein UFOVP1214_18 [uncultured Caudovirales phage]
MTSPTITSVTINSVNLDLNDVILDVIITHGRGAITDEGRPSTLDMRIFATGQITVPYTLGQLVNVKANSTNRFTGYITDMAISHSTTIDGQPPMTIIDVTAVGKLANLSRFYSDTTRPAEDLQTRVDAILTATGLTYAAQADPNYALLEVLAANAQLQDARTQLDTLNDWTGGTLYDKPDGTVVFESYTRRGYNYATAAWEDMPLDWDNTTLDWISQYAPGSSAPTAVTLPVTAVVWEPRWYATASTIVNDVTVSYGAADPQLDFQDTDAASIAAFGSRAIKITTGLSDVGDAANRASLVLTAQATERWTLGGVEILMETLTAPQLTAVMALTSGDRVIVTNLPSPGPIGQFLGVLEGWTETYTIDGYRLTLALSDPRYSYAMLQWNQAGTADWANVPIATTWSDVILQSDLV